MSDKQSHFKVELDNSLDFVSWTRDCRRLELRCGCLQYWEQQVLLAPAPIAIAAVPANKRDAWNKLRADLEGSVVGEAQQHLRGVVGGIDAMNACEVWIELRNNGNGGAGFAAPSFEQQQSEKIALDSEELKFHNQTMKPHGYVANLLEKMERLPQIYPANAAGSIMHHLVISVSFRHEPSPEDMPPPLPWYIPRNPSQASDDFFSGLRARNHFKSGTSVSSTEPHGSRSSHHLEVPT